MRVQRLAALRAERRRARLLLHIEHNAEMHASLDAATAAPQSSTFIARSEDSTNSQSTRSAVRVFLIALTIGWSVDFLFYGKSLGISVPIFVLLLLSALIALPLAQGNKLVISNLWLLVPTLFFASMVFIRANALLTFLNLSATLLLLCLVIYFSTAGRIERLGMVGYPMVIASVVGHLLTQPAPSVNLVGRKVVRRRPNVKIAVPLLRGLVLAIPVLILFGALLASADSLFQRFITDLFGLKAFSDVPEMLLHLLLILSAAWLVAGGLLIILSRGMERQRDRARADTLPDVGHIPPLIGFIEAATILGLVNLLFAVFAWIQFTNIFFGQPTGMPFEEYRDYVRGGFGQLLLVAVLTIGLILGVRLLARSDASRQTRLLQVMSTIMVVLTFVMLVSAYKRMDAWEDVQFYINTQVRIYVRTFIVWLAFTMWFRRDRFAIGAFVAALGFLVTVNLANPDADVAAYNLRRNDELSIRYLDLLSDDAVPILTQGMLDTEDPVIRQTIQQNLSQRLVVLESDPDRQSWQSFHLARSQAYDLLSELKRNGQLSRTP